MARIAELSNVAQLYGLIVGDSQDEQGNEVYTGTIGLLRYVIAHGDTTVEKFQQYQNNNATGNDERIERIERTKYVFYERF